MLTITRFSPSLEPPQFIKKPSPVLVLRNGQSTTFECQITGTPEIRVSWYLDGNEITAVEKHGISFIDGLATFQISGARVENSGTYVCEAQNDAGAASCSIELKVKGALLLLFSTLAMLLAGPWVFPGVSGSLSPF